MNIVKPVNKRGHKITVHRDRLKKNFLRPKKFIEISEDSVLDDTQIQQPNAAIPSSNSINDQNSLRLVNNNNLDQLATPVEKARTPQTPHIVKRSKRLRKPPDRFIAT